MNQNSRIGTSSAWKDPRLASIERTDDLRPDIWVREQCDALTQRFSQPPIYPSRICKELGIDLQITRSGHSRGVLDMEKGHQYSIKIRTVGGSKERERFAAAHELIHYMIAEYSRTLPDRKLRSSTNHREVERLCNFGAMELLMPHRWIRNFTDIDLYDMRFIRSLSKAYKVTEYMAAGRLAQLDRRTLLTRWSSADTVHWKVVDVIPKPPISTIRVYPFASSDKRLDPDVVSQVWDNGEAVSSTIRFQHWGELNGLYYTRAIPLEDNVNPEQHSLFHENHYKPKKGSQVILFIDLLRRVHRSDVQLTMDLLPEPLTASST